MYFILHFLDGTIDCSVSDVLEFLSGSTSVPPNGFDEKPRVEFNFSDDSVPTASTCSLCLQLPTAHENEQSFIEAFCFALKGNVGFGQV